MRITEWITRRRAWAFSLKGMFAFTTACALIVGVWMLMRQKGDEPPRVISLAVSLDGTTAAGLFDKGLARVWDLGTAKELRTVDVGQSAERVVLSKDGSRLIVADYDFISTWDVRSGARLMSYPVAGYIRGFSYDGELFVVCGGSSLEVRSAADGRVKVTLDAIERRSPVFDCRAVYDPSGELLALGDGGKVHLLSASDLRIHRICDLGEPTAFCSDGGFLAAINLNPIDGYLDFGSCIWSGIPKPPPAQRIHNGELILLDIANGTTFRRANLQRVVCDPVPLADKEHFAVLTTDGIQTWNIASGLRQSRIDLPNAYMMAAAPGRDLLITVGAGGVWLWDSKTFVPHGRLWHTDGQVRHVPVAIISLVLVSWCAATGANWTRRRRVRRPRVVLVSRSRHPY